jgi:hypothetical protein
MKIALKYGAGLIGLYLAVYYYTGAGTLLKDATGGGTQVIQALQARGGSGSTSYPTAA